MFAGGVFQIMHTPHANLQNGRQRVECGQRCYQCRPLYRVALEPRLRRSITEASKAAGIT